MIQRREIIQKVTHTKFTKNPVQTIRIKGFYDKVENIDSYGLRERKSEDGSFYEK